MNYLRTNPTGIDYYIQQLQIFLYARIKDTCGLTDATYDCYGRAYRNETSDGYAPEAYIGGNEYKELYYNDKVYAQSLFGMSKPIKSDEVQYSATVSLIFCVNLAKLGFSTDREDETIRNIVSDFCNLNQGFVVTEIVFDSIKNVFKDYSSNYLERSKFTNMHPKHCFRIDLSIVYNLNDNCLQPITTLN